MVMTIEEYLAKQEPQRRELLSSIHEVVLKTNKKISMEVAKMMGTDMIQYKMNSQFVYALGGTKNHMSLHLLPMYMHKPIHEKYAKLLPKAKFQKGCINFENVGEIPLDIAEQLLTECAKVDLKAMLEKRNKK
jgi:diadenosine tetraphosphate (Ap4A) HIT family hydrolase